MMGWDTSINLRTGLPTVPMTRTTAPNPLIVDYEASDGKRFWLLGLEGDRHWPAVLRAVDRPELADDPRFAELFARAANAGALVELLDPVFAARTRDEWGEIFDREGVWWAPVQATHELVDDGQAHAAGCFVDAPLLDGSVARPWPRRSTSARRSGHRPARRPSSASTPKRCCSTSATTGTPSSS